MTSSFCRLFDVFVDNGSLFRRGIVNSIEVLNFKSSLTFRSLNRTMDSHGDSSDRQSSEQTQPIKRFGWRPLCEIPSGSSTPSRNRQPSTSSRNSVLKTPEKSRIMGMETNNASGLQNQKRTSDSVSNTSGPTPNSKVYDTLRSEIGQLINLLRSKHITLRLLWKLNLQWQLQHEQEFQHLH